MLRATLAAALVCFRAPAVWARQLNEDDGANEDYASESYVARYAGSYADGGLYDAPEAYQACQWEWVDDGTCDALCNAAERDWDGKDCFHDAPECYNKDNGADYRGTVNVTQSGLPCQRWSEQFPNTHAFSVYAYPFAGLGGHNLCRNPQPDDGSVRPWCLVDSIDGPEWEYCDVPPPTADRCDPDYLPTPQALTTLTMGAWVVGWGVGGMFTLRGFMLGCAQKYTVQAEGAADGSVRVRKGGEEGYFGEVGGSRSRPDKLPKRFRPIPPPLYSCLPNVIPQTPPPPNTHTHHYPQRPAAFLPQPPPSCIAAGKWSEQFFIYEAAYHFYQVVVPPSVQSVEVVLFPEDGDPDLFLSFDVE